MTIKFPDFKKMYDYETNFHLTMNSERLAKLICHYEIFKKVTKIRHTIYLAQASVAGPVTTIPKTVRSGEPIIPVIL